MNQRVILNGKSEEIPEELQLPAYEEHNLDIIPLHHFLNKQRDISQIHSFIELSDAYPVENQIKALNTIRAQQLKEALLNTTKIYGNFSPAFLLQLQKNQQASNISRVMLSDLYIQANRGDGAGGKLVEISQANPQLNTYDNAINEQLKHI